MIKRIFHKFISVLGVMTLLMLIYASGLGIYIWLHRKEIPPRAVIEINLSEDYPECASDDPISDVIGGKPLTVRHIIEGLEAASTDDRVAALLVFIGNISMGFGQIQEIRDAVLSFRSKGKPAIAYADTFGEFGPGNRAYYLASAFDKIYMQPSGDVALTGLIFQTPFIKGTLDKLGVVPRMDHRFEYKNAMNTFTQTGYTEPHKESLTAIMTSLNLQLTADISTSRNLSESEVKAVFEKGLFLGKEALDAKLVDGLMYKDSLIDDVKKIAGDTRLPLSTYISKADNPHSKGDTLALIYGVGGIRRGKNKYNPMFDKSSMGSDSVTSAFRSAIEDQDVKAIIFRIDSPGGSYVASDSIWRETLRAKEKGKPVIVTMADVAGSGGYFIAMSADKIVAHPATITGSIGVLAGKMVTSGFMEKIGISWDEIHTDPYASMWTDIRDYSPEQWQRLQDMLDRIYSDFTEKAAKGRNLTLENLQKAAKGRIWTGDDAKKIGLVDELGGFPTAIRLAKEAAGIPNDASITLKVFPKEKSWVDKLMKKATRRSEDTDEETVLKDIQQMAHVLKRLGVFQQDGVLTMPSNLYPE